VIQLDIANSIFLLCLIVGGALLLITILVDDVLGGLLDAFHLSFDIGGVSLMPPLLGFVSMFGVGGLVGTQILGLDNGRASLLGAVLGTAGAGLVLLMWNTLKKAEGAPAFSLSELVGKSGRVTVAIPAHRFGTVMLSHAGMSHQLGATADQDIGSGTPVRVTEVVGTNVVVEPIREGGTS
jgi:membrane-bound ClpP family serine protease